jgi:hypothetical protein
MTSTKPRPNSFTLDSKDAPTDGKQRNAGKMFRTICTCNGRNSISPWRESSNIARIDGAVHFKENHAGEPR